MTLVITLAWQSPSLGVYSLDDEGDSHTRKEDWFGMTHIMKRGLLYGLLHSANGIS